MGIDSLLTSNDARERIGNLVVGNEYYRDFLEKWGKNDTLRDPTHAFKLEYNPDVYDITWTFSSESRLVKALKQFHDIEKEQGVSSIDKRSQDIRREVDDDFRITGIPSLLDNYHIQTSEFDVNLRTYDLFQESGEIFTLNTGQSITEGLFNAIEHGSDFGRKGDVRLRFLGGEKGALVLIEDPGLGFNLQPRSSEELERMYHLAGGDPREPSKIRGMGLQVYTTTEKAIIGYEQEEGLFRLIALYPIPEKDKLEAYVKKVRSREPPKPNLTALEDRLDDLWLEPIDDLPWKEVESALATGKRAYRNRTKWLVQNLGLNLTGDAFTYFKDAVEEHGRPPKYAHSMLTGEQEPTYIGKRSYEIICEVFRRVGLELPKAKF